MPAEREQSVRSFLFGLKLAIQKSYEDSSAFVLTTRDKNMKTIARLELTVSDIKEEIMSLSLLDYCDGPCQDPTIKGDVWIFGKEVREEELYIKLKLSGDSKLRQLRVLSFHEPEQKLHYYFKGTSNDRQGVKGGGDEYNILSSLRQQRGNKTGKGGKGTNRSK